MKHIKFLATIKFCPFCGAELKQLIPIEDVHDSNLGLLFQKCSIDFREYCKAGEAGR